MARAITPEHLRAAFDAMAWQGWTFEAALQDKARKAMLSWRARQLCDAQAKAGRRAPSRPTNRRTPRTTPVAQPDFKRLAAGDRDD